MDQEEIDYVLARYMNSGMYLSKEFHKKYGFAGLQTYGQTWLKDGKCTRR